jgi:tetratricopeptide repeat protein
MNIRASNRLFILPREAREMESGNYSVEASIIEAEKLVKGTLTLFNDEYVFGSKRKSVNWENVVCEKGVTTVKSFFRTIKKQYIVFNYNGNRSPEFILEAAQLQAVLDKVKEYVDSIVYKRETKEAKKDKEEEERKRQIKEEKRIREESRQRAEEEFRLQEEENRLKKEQQEQRELQVKNRRITEKNDRIAKEIDSCKNKYTENIEISNISIKAATVFLDNPYRVLGISCVASKEDANSVLDKLKKLARLKALEAYSSPFDLLGIEKPVRDLSVAQNALSLLKDRTNKLFWFKGTEACVAWQSEKFRIELSKDGEEFGTYDLFLANYMYAILCDPNFNLAETWKRIFNHYCFICRQTNCELLRTRYSEKEKGTINNSELLNSFKNTIFKPLLLLCERDDLDAVIRLHKYIKDCDNRLLEGVARNVVGKLVSWFTDKETAVMSSLSNDDEYISESRAEEIHKIGEQYCSVVEPVLQIVLRDFRGDAVRYDMIKESYRSTTYQLMYELDKCINKSYAIIYANKCYVYYDSDTKMRIKNAFGEANIKTIDWNIPHTGWDAKGDDFYFGRGYAVDYTQALYWYHKAANEGNKYSQNSIGVCYQKGYGVPQSDVKAVMWFKQAAENGNPVGAYNLAECYFEGKGINRNVDKALKYWGEAAKNGHPSAEQRKTEVFSKIQVQRRTHRAKNHILKDLGFQMTVGPGVYVEVTLNKPAYVYLVNALGYQNYLNGNEFTYQGGYATDSVYSLRIPTSNRWYIIVDNGDDDIDGITAVAKVRS